MSTPTLTRAAEMLELDAAELLLCHTTDGDWGDEHEAREAHYEMLAVAAELRAMIAAAPEAPEQAAQPADVARHPTPEDARKMGEKGGPVVEAERLAFEAWMAGHCWALCATWNGKEYRGDAEAGHYICPRAMNTRQLWAAWRDRAALAAKGGDHA